MQLRRDLDSLECYAMHKQITREMFGDTEEYIHTKLFDTPWRPYTFCTNHFGYITPHKHMVFFINPKFKNFYDLQRVKEIIGKHEVIWENVNERKSVFSIPHYQVYT